jgi:hypothetical protein
MLFLADLLYTWPPCAVGWAGLMGIATALPILPWVAVFGGPFVGWAGHDQGPGGIGVRFDRWEAGGEVRTGDPQEAVIAANRGAIASQGSGLSSCLRGHFPR